MKIPLPICHLSNPPKVRPIAFIAIYGGSAIISLAIIAVIYQLILN